MADLQEHDPSTPSNGNDDAASAAQAAANAGAALDSSRANKRRAPDDDDDDDDKPGRERRKIDIKFIQDKSRRHITFSKRKAGIMKKAYELSVLTGTQVLLLVVSETGLVYTFTTPKLQPLVTKPEGKNLIQACLNAPSPTGDSSNGLDDQGPPVESPEEPNHAQLPPQAAGMPRQAPMPAPSPYGMTPDHIAYQNYLAQQQQVQGQGGGSYPGMPGQARMPAHPGHQ
ncbi:MAG: transcription factor of the MADS box [Chrysothrix sp. TS-e1954]|nr:MAG: transcription factor of the MADS box [Chrysothrix sp. TS-e1954]